MVEDVVTEFQPPYATDQNPSPNQVLGKRVYGVNSSMYGAIGATKDVATEFQPAYETDQITPRKRALGKRVFFLLNQVICVFCFRIILDDIKFCLYFLLFIYDWHDHNIFKTVTSVARI